MYARMCAELAPREVALDVGGEVVAVAFDDRGHRALPSPVAPRVELATTRAAILDLLDGRITLLDAVLADRIVLRGGLDDVIAFHDGLMTYLHGAVRSFAMPGLLRSYRRQPTHDETSLQEQEDADT